MIETTGNPLPSPPPLPFQDQENKPPSSKEKLYRVYAKLISSEIDKHVTVCNTFADEKEFYEFLTAVRAIPGTTGTPSGAWRIPCDINIVLHRDPKTRISSPSHTLEKAFANSPELILNWMRTAEMLNGPSVIADLLAPFMAKEQFGYLPFCHTEKRAFDRHIHSQIFSFSSCEFTAQQTGKGYRERLHRQLNSEKVSYA